MARLIASSRRHLENLVKDRVVTAIKIGRAVRFRPSDVFRDLRAYETHVRPVGPRHRRRRPPVLLPPPPAADEDGPQPPATEETSR